MAARADACRGEARAERRGGGVLSIDLQLILLFIYGKNLLIDTEFVFCVSAWAPMELNIAPPPDRLSRPVLEKKPRPVPAQPDTCSSVGPNKI